MLSFVEMLLSLQTYLEQTKTKFNKDYKALNSAAITTTVGLNSMRIMLARGNLCICICSC